MDTVTMRHPSLPDQPITVPASAVPHHQASGWERVEDAPAAPAPEPLPQAAPVEEQTAAEETPDTKPARRRRTQEGE
ncbi:hypothetical protein STRCI_001265 [Streptomyces cinnabarinus]|uniref:Uncharacterized protein n=1 Tax=Streptomyces cinnabarinus TaxID=67287 RepID=A0ABY7KB60_9ACTN|nr:hypothetical protein [Streptomyces cinnabarinus]WAZ20166.1 hypothetical protein STRCI_001265 [Streptomyces cinnabarinus]